MVGRIGKRDDEGPDWVSRDAVLLVKCARAQCLVNSSLHCSMPSKIQINAKGECMTGIEFKERPAVQPKATVCRWCGGLIKRKKVVFEFNNTNGYQPINCGWEHIEEKLSHPAEPR
jgi:hypothetical protein